MQTQNYTPILLLVDLLTLVPSPLPYVRRLRRRKFDLHLLWLTPNHVERSLLKSLKVKRRRDLEALISQDNRVNSFDRKDPKILLALVKSDNVEPAVHVPETIWVDLVFDELFVLRSSMTKPNCIVMKNCLRQRFDDALGLAVVLSFTVTN